MELLDAFDGVEVGRRLGHDLYCCSRLPPRPDWPPSVREGFDAAAARGLRRAAADRFERKWLQLRLSAWQRSRVVAPDVTPELLREIDVSHCPVTREPLTHGLRADTDASVDRLNNDGAYAPGNLAVMSVRANRAKGALSFEAVLARAQGQLPADTLSPAEWLRLAVLMLGPSFASCPERAPLLPLVAPLPQHSVRLALQQIQRLFTLQAVRPAGRNALVRDLSRAGGSELALLRLRQLGDAVHQGLRALQADEQPWDVWLQAAPMQALAAWRAALDEAAWRRAARIACELAGGRRVGPSHLTPWHLASGGRWPAPARLQIQAQ